MRITFSSTRTLVLACAICAVPAALLSAVQRSWESVFVFYVVAFLHGLIIGLPVFHLLAWRKAANALTCTVAGLLIGVVPYALFFSRGVSGPGVNHTRTLLLFAVSGAAIGAVFWMLMAGRMRDRD